MTKEVVVHIDNVPSSDLNKAESNSVTKGIPGKKHRTTMQSSLLKYLCEPESKGDIRKAMKLAGYSPKASIAEVVAPLKEDIIEACKTALTLSAPKAVFALVNALDDPSMIGAKNLISSAKEILDRVGVVKEGPIESISKRGGIFILPPKD